MADTKISALTANTTPAAEDLIAEVDDPGGTPITKKSTLGEVLDNVGIVADTTPQLGGNLDMNSKTITGTVAITGGDLILDNTQEVNIKDSGGTARRIISVNAGDQITLGAIDVSWGALTVINAGTGMVFQVNAASGSFTRAIDIATDGDVAIGIASPAAQLHIDQSSTSGAEPVLLLDQADIDEDYFKIIGTSDTNVDRALVDAADFTTPGSIVGWLKINIQDDQSTNPITDGDYYLPFYGAPSA